MVAPVHEQLVREQPVVVPCDDRWNAVHRDEAPMQRADRNFAELLQELRVVQIGVQILFAFLLTLPFTDRFAGLGPFGHGVYVFTLVASALTVTLLVTPVAVHRLCFQRGRKRELVRAGHRLVMAGLVCLAATVLAGMLLVLDVVVGPIVGGLVTGVLAVVIAGLWVCLPMRVRRG
ncbi:MAG: DUF6328 family protein [Pseudonocardia sp.]